jgi:hypothetical protein
MGLVASDTFMYLFYSKRVCCNFKVTPWKMFTEEKLSLQREYIRISILILLPRAR